MHDSVRSDQCTLENDKPLIMKKLWIEDNETIPAVVFQEQSPGNNYSDKSNDLVAWSIYGIQVLDFDRCRTNMKPIFYSLVGPQLQNWPNLTDEVKKIAVDFFFVPYQLRLTIVTDDQDAINWERILILTQGTPTQLYVGRAKTFDMMRICVAHRVRKEMLSMSDSQQMLKDVGLIVDWYIRTNAPDFFMWLSNQVGTPYENDGFAQKSYYSVGLRDELLDIYNGNY